MVLTNVNFFHNSVKKFFGENRKEKRDEQEVIMSNTVICIK